MNSLTTTPTPTLTHPETAWLVTAVPLALTVAAILVCALLLRGTLRPALIARLARREHRASRAIEPALVYTPHAVSEARLLISCLASAALVLAILSWIAPLVLAIILTGPLAALLIWAQLWALEQRYIARLDAALPAAVGRLEAQLRGGSGLQTALRRLLVDLPDGPLTAEWGFLVATLGTPLRARTLATPAHVVAALLVQTPSERHAAFLAHLELALEQPHSAMVQRVKAAYVALQAAEQRRSAAATELAQMRYSGVAISLAGLTMAFYLFLTEHERFAVAYAGPLGAVVGCVVVAALLAPFVGGALLAQATDLDY